MRLEFTGRWVKGYSRFMKTIDSFTLQRNHPEIGRRLEIINFFQEFGLTVTKRAYKVS